MTTACHCFGRNENCAMCSGTGIVLPEVERRAELKNSNQFHSLGQTEKQKKLDVSANEARQKSAETPIRKGVTRAEMDAAFEKKWKDEIAERVAWAESRRLEEAESRETHELANQAALAEAERKRSIQLKNDQIRSLREVKEKALIATLQAKSQALAQGKKVTGPYRCMRCQWINDSDKTPCFLCKSTGRYAEIF